MSLDTAASRRASTSCARVRATRAATFAVVDGDGAVRRRGQRAGRLREGRGLRHRPRQRDGVRAGGRRAPLHRPADGRAARGQGRQAARRAVRAARRRLDQRARPDRRRPASGLRQQRLRLRLLHDDRAAARTTASAASPPTATSRSPAARRCWSTCRSCRRRPTTTAARMHFGPDGKLYVGVGDNANGANAKDLAIPFGKLLRFNDDGSIPDRQPVLRARRRGLARAIWASACATPSPSRSSRAPAPVHQRRRRGPLGGDRHRRGRRQLRLARQRRADLGRRRHRAALRLPAHAVEPAGLGAGRLLHR